MKNKKLLLVSVIFMVSFFTVKLLFNLFIWRNEWSSIDMRVEVISAIFFGLIMGLLIKFKWIKTKNILQE